MDPLHLQSLQPQQIGRLFGRSSMPEPPTPNTKTTTRVIPFLAIALISLIAISLLAISQNVMTAQAGPSALAVMISAPKTVTNVEMPLSQDPVAIVFILVALLTPIFCAQQVKAIQGIVQMNVDNFEARPDYLRQPGQVPTSKLDEHVQKANRAFCRVGNPIWSFLFLVLSALISYLIYALLLARGLLRSWNATSVPSTRWGKMVYAGWWANYQHHQVLAIALFALGTYLFYFLLKQLALGAIFAQYAAFASRAQFGIIPNMEYNSDGHWGLRRLRRFMQWTFASTTAHFIATLGVFIVWLRFSQLTVALAAFVMVANSVMVFQPSLLAYHSVLDSKLSYVKKIAQCDKLSHEEKERYYDRIWNNPNLPFRTRSTTTAVTVYLLLPLTLAYVSSLITRK